jgi:hypothetical protein
MAEEPDDLTDEERALFAAYRMADDLAASCRRLEDVGYSGGSAIDAVMNTLMTCLWDHCFSQTEIRNAFNAALADMNRYAAGDEIRP